MTVWEFAIAREAGRLIREKEHRDLTQKEWVLLRTLLPCLLRYEMEEQALDEMEKRCRRELSEHHAG
jgi:hypothetical protein